MKLYKQQEKVEEPLAIKKALVVEDNHIFIRVLCGYLSYLSYQVEIEIATDATAGIHLIKSNAYDLIITDLGLPGQSGIEVIHAVCKYELNQKTPLIVCSAYEKNKTV